MSQKLNRVGVAPVEEGAAVQMTNLDRTVSDLRREAQNIDLKWFVANPVSAVLEHFKVDGKQVRSFLQHGRIDLVCRAGSDHCRSSGALARSRQK
jgi:hypothetical protein